MSTATPETATGHNFENSAPDEPWHEAFTLEEIQSLVHMSDWKSWRTLGVNWSITFAAMALAATWPNPLTILLALFIIGTRQLGLAVIMHEAAHRSFFADKRTNDTVASWLACYPIWSDLHSYRPYHLQHHSKTWTDEDPDRHLALPFPITKQSFKRKVVRDLSGQTGIRFMRFAVRRDLALALTCEGNALERIRLALANPNFRGMLITNGILLGGLTLAGHPWLFLLWVVSYLTTNTLVTRIRAIAEHTMSPDIANPFQNTRTTLASGWERLFIAPNRVNYHLEHHLLMTVPHYNLPRMHRMLAERGLLDGALVTRGYAGVLDNATSREA